MKNIRMNPEIMKYVETKILPLYKTFDKAHRENHVKKVIEESLRLAEYYSVDPNMVYVIAAYHDLGLCEGREFHHIKSGEILLSDNKMRKFFDEIQLKLMSEAIEDHRASSTHEPRSIYGKLVAEADRDIEPMRIFERILQYGQTHYPEFSKNEHYERFRSHLREKYGVNGYLKLWIPESKNAQNLQELRTIISDESRIEKIFNDLFQQAFTSPEEP